MNSLSLEGLHPGTVALLGVPFDANSSFLRGSALAPDRIREVLYSGATNLWTETGVDLGSGDTWRDAGNVSSLAGPDPIDAIAAAATSVINTGAHLLSLGGDHSVTVPLVRAHAAVHDGLTILHIDAHPDLYHDFEGNAYSHASPFARIMETGTVRRLVQIGIRTLNAHQREQAARFGVEMITMRDFRPDLRLALEAPVYVSLDLDALDPAFAPGVSHHEPGGLSVRDILRLLWRLDVPILGADIVEYNPVRDHAGITASVAAKFCKELLALLHGSAPST